MAVVHVVQLDVKPLVQIPQRVDIAVNVVCGNLFFTEQINLQTHVDTLELYSSKVFEVDSEQHWEIGVDYFRQLNFVVVGAWDFFLAN